MSMATQGAKHRLPWAKVSIGLFVSLFVMSAAVYARHLQVVTINPSLYPQSWVQYGLNQHNNAVYAKTVQNQSWSTPLGSSAHGGLSLVKGYVYVGDNADEVSKLSANTGKKVWTTKLNNEVMTQPLVINGSVFVGTGNNQFQPSGIRGTGQNEIASLNSKTGKIQWTIPTRAEDMPSLVYSHGLLYGVNGAGTLRAINPTTGHVEWQISLNGIDSMDSPVIHNGMLYVGLSKPYDVVAVNLSTHHIVFRTPIQDAQLALDDSAISYGQGMIYAESAAIKQDPLNQETVWGINAKTGAVEWRFTEPSGAKLTPEEYEAAAPVFHRGVVYFGTPFGKKLYAVNATTGALDWQVNLRDAANQTPVIIHNDVVVGDAGGTFYVIDKQNGHILATKQLPKNEIFTNGAPMVVNDVFYSPTAVPKKSGSVTAIALTPLDPNINKSST